MDSRNSSGNPLSRLADEIPAGVMRQIRQGAVLGVVTSSELSYTRLSSVIRIETGKATVHELLMKHNAGFLVGRMVIYLPHDGAVVLADDDSYQFAVVASLSESESVESKCKTITCPECGSRVGMRKLRSHLRRIELYVFV